MMFMDDFLSRSIKTASFCKYATLRLLIPTRCSAPFEVAAGIVSVVWIELCQNLCSRQQTIVDLGNDENREFGPAIFNQTNCTQGFSFYSAGRSSRARMSRHPMHPMASLARFVRALRPIDFKRFKITLRSYLNVNICQRFTSGRNSDSDSCNWNIPPAQDVLMFWRMQDMMRVTAKTLRQQVMYHKSMFPSSI
jgi:hypothetical protein